MVVLWGMIEVPKLEFLMSFEMPQAIQEIATQVWQISRLGHPFPSAWPVLSSPRCLILKQITLDIYVVGQLNHSYDSMTVKYINYKRILGTYNTKFKFHTTSYL